MRSMPYLLDHSNHMNVFTENGVGRCHLADALELGLRTAGSFLWGTGDLSATPVHGANLDTAGPVVYFKELILNALSLVFCLIFKKNVLHLLTFDC